MDKELMARIAEDGISSPHIGRGKKMDSEEVKKILNQQGLGRVTRKGNPQHLWASASHESRQAMSS